MSDSDRASREQTGTDRPAAVQVLAELQHLYPDAECALRHASPWQLLCATILSAQCTDARVNTVTPGLFERYPDPEAMATARLEEVEQLVRSTGYYHQKALSLIGMSQDIVGRFGGEVPVTLDELTTLRGVGRKTANVLLGVAFGVPAVVVDTHVKRLSMRLGWTTESDPEKIEQDLMQLFPPERWTALAHTLILHGRTLCSARSPHCADCPVNTRCPEGKQRMSEHQYGGKTERLGRD